MGITSFSRSPVLTVLLAPLQALAALFMPASTASSPSSTHPVSPRRTVPRHPLNQAIPSNTGFALKAAALNNRSARADGHKPCQTVVRATSPRRLKVVREFEAGISPSCAGRMVISGRMADVCAELDRMAQKEAATQTA